MKSQATYSSSLFNYPNFLKGMARIWDTNGSLNQYRYLKTDEAADYHALQRDWRLVGQSIREALRQYVTKAK